MTTTSAATIAVLDMGKTNVKLSAATADGHILETISTPNTVRDGPPWRHNDLEGLGDWTLSELSGLCRRHPVAHIIAAAYGSGGVLVGDDPDSKGGGAILPMIDYEQPLPDGLNDDYLPLAGSFFDRGSATMQAAAHQARQLFWMQRAEPQRFATARWYLGLPQYWAWKFSGRVAAETSFLGAQSHLWNAVERRFAPIVDRQGWRHLMPEFAKAWAALGTLRPELTRRFGLPATIDVHTGVHDSSANFYLYQATGDEDFTVISTGTWIVALADRVQLDALDERRNMTCNSDVFGHPLGGALTMAGREFSHVAGEQPHGALADVAVVERIIARGTLALPAFGIDSGQFPSAAGHGRIVGPPPVSAAERLGLSVLYMALLSVTCADALGAGRRVVLDGSYLRDPLYARLVAALRPGSVTLYNYESYGVAAGAALLCGHETRRNPISLTLDEPAALTGCADLSAYATRWLDLSQTFANMEY